jgi:hypothetical protein
MQRKYPKQRNSLFLMSLDDTDTRTNEIHVERLLAEKGLSCQTTKGGGHGHYKKEEGRKEAGEGREYERKRARNETKWT